eukprot:5836119-Amphidinium_carterae.2
MKKILPTVGDANRKVAAYVPSNPTSVSCVTVSVELEKDVGMLNITARPDAITPGCSQTTCSYISCGLSMY